MAELSFGITQLDFKVHNLSKVLVWETLTQEFSNLISFPFPSLNNIEYFLLSSNDFMIS